MQFPNLSSGFKSSSLSSPIPPSSGKKESTSDCEVTVPYPGYDAEPISNESSWTSSSTSSGSSLLSSSFNALRIETELRQQSSTSTVSSSSASSSSSSSGSDYAPSSSSSSSSAPVTSSSASALSDLDLYSTESRVLRAYEHYIIASSLCPDGSGTATVRSLVQIGLGFAFNNVVKKFKDEGRPDRDLEEIETIFQKDQSVYVNIGSDELGWTQFTFRTLLQAYGAEKEKECNG